ncbi:hypothetical protein K457DRAFT_140134 [Linnemannia elongata AG-77]|uniref:Transmembrane protein n=1 Tax=Linnemannia elongata AG-77 TaxID=1314771 RepID=A0A197JQC6_9FUNG|nr:hypothetical protein K457DRAFT_140134 [Linnemannia elongata AG-77]
MIRTQKEDSQGFYSPVRSSLDLTTLTRQRFRQTAYSLLSATLMGSSLGLVIYQQRIISLLYNDTTTTNVPLYPASIETSTATAPTSTTTTFERFSVFLLSCWFPVAVWFVALMSTSFLVGLKNFVPRCFTPRTGILVSHLVFSVVWVILASVQEVHENLSSSSRQQQPQGGVWPTDSSDSVQTNNNVMGVEQHPSVSSLQQPQLYQKYPSMQQRQQGQQGQALRDSNLSSLAVSLCVVWYVAVILLGVATALLAASSTVLDSMMDEQIQELLTQVEEDVVECDEEKGLSFRNTVTDTVDKDTKEVTTPARRTQYPLVQKLTLGLMILVLFYSQMWFFEWIHSALTSLSSGPAVSTRLSLFGIFSSSIMVTLGARLLPVTTTSTIGSR